MFRNRTNYFLCFFTVFCSIQGLCFGTTVFANSKPALPNSKSIPANQSKPTRDADHPIVIQSDSAIFDEMAGTALYSGNVVMDQGSRHLTSDTLTLKRGSDGKIDELKAVGAPARFHAQPDPLKPISSGHGNIVHYFPKQEKVHLLENAELSQKENVIQGSHLTYLLNTQVLTSQHEPGKRTTMIIHKDNP